MIMLHFPPRGAILLRGAIRPENSSSSLRSRSATAAFAAAVAEGLGGAPAAAAAAAAADGGGAGRFDGLKADDGGSLFDPAVATAVVAVSSPATSGRWRAEDMGGRVYLEGIGRLRRSSSSSSLVVAAAARAAASCLLLIVGALDPPTPPPTPPTPMPLPPILSFSTPTGGRGVVVAGEGRAGTAGCWEDG